jgi:hypothetical protein
MKTRHTATVLFVTIACTLTFGCKRKSRSYAPSDGTETPGNATPSDGVQATGLAWQDATLVVKGLPDAKGFLLEDDKSIFRLKASFYGFPAGTSIAFGNEMHAVTSTGSLERRVDIGPDLGNAEYQGLLDAPWARNLSVAITFPGGKNFSVQVPPQSQYATKRMLATGFASVRESPVVFPHEPPAPVKPRNVFYAPDPIGIADPEIIGTIKQVHDVDRVAVEKRVPTETTISCHGYKKSGDNGPSESISVRLVSSEVQLFDRRTAKLIETKTFAASKTCPMMTFGRKGEEEKNYAARDAVKDWLRTTLRSGK